jgi:imidazolonepropionase-like amidohydrolase
MGSTRRRPLTLLVTASMLIVSRAAVAQEPSLVIANTTLIDGTGAPARDGVTILIRNGMIAAISPAEEATAPQGATVIDGAGRYVIPGLADMHVHFGTGGLVPSDSLTVDRVLRQFLFYGVTTVLNLGATNGDVDEILELRRQRHTGERRSPHVYATGGLLTVPGSHPIATIMTLPEGADADTYDWSRRGVWVVRTPADVRKVVSQLAAADMDGIKVVIESGPGPFGDDHPRMSLELVTAAVDEARNHGLPVFAHATSPDELEDGVAAGVHALVHLVGSEPVAPRLLSAMRQRGIYEIPTLSLFVWADVWSDPADALTDPFLRSGVEDRVIESLLTSPLAPTSPPTAEDWASRRAVLRGVKAVRDAGVTIVAGTDTNNPFVFPGFSIHHELELMVEAGLTPMEALETATRHAAEMMNEQAVFGTVERGKRADLLLLGANPLDDIRNTRTLEMVILGGTVIDHSSLLQTR